MKKARHRRRGGIFLFLLLFLVLLTADSNVRIVTREYQLSYDTLPRAFDGFRIVQLSDLHAGSFGTDNIRLISAVTAARPDIIAVTGDLVDGEGQGGYVRELMTALTAIAPVYYVTGNHEWASGMIGELFDILDDCGVTALRNTYTVLERGGASILLAGLEDPNGPADMETPGQVMEQLREETGGGFTVLLAHRNRVEEYALLGAQLVLCGHAHGGLIRLPFTDGLIDTNRDWFPTYTCGVYTENGTDVLVSPGLGNSVPVPRFLNNPQVCVAVLHAAG